ncbi:ABC transporter substrate-binding protein [Candidatus Bathyarchaeota archaeon]|nr:ABC transporter substrate-binding protein [Candidatus Bathyarchaeota archaeon]
MRIQRSWLILVLVAALAFIVYRLPVQEEPAAVDEEKGDESVRIAVTYEMLGETVQIWPHPVSEEKVLALINMTEAEINSYCEENQSEYRFRLVPTPVLNKGGTSGDELPPGLEETMQLDEDGVSLVVGHDFSRANRYSLEYADEHGMLLLSPSGVGLGQSLPGDCLHKLMPNIYEDPEVYERVFADMIRSMGYEAFVTIGSGGHVFMRSLLDETGEALSYPYRETEVVMDINADDLGPYLRQAAEYVNETAALYGVENMCVLVEPLGVDKLTEILTNADSHSVLSKVKWFDYGGIPEEGITEENLGARLARYGFTQMVMCPTDSPRSEEFYRKYVDHVGAIPTPNKVYGEAARYDAAWLMALAVIETGSAEPQEVKEALPTVCERYQGVLGDCSLNEYGDRAKTDYRIYEWILVDGEARFDAVGYYDSSTGSFTFTR